MHAEKARRRADRSYAHQYEASGTGFFRFILGLVITALIVIWAITLWSIVFHGIVFGYPVVSLGTAGAGLFAHPTILAIIFITALLYVLALPLKLLMKNARPRNWSHYSFFNDLVQSIFFIFALYLVFYIGGMLFPVIHEAWNMVLGSVRSL